MSDLPPGVRKVAGYMPISAELAADAGAVRAAIAQAMDDMHEVMDREFRPWLYPDPCPFSRMVLFPRLARLGRWAK